jgi:hypothetical protein
MKVKLYKLIDYFNKYILPGIFILGVYITIFWTDFSFFRGNENQALEVLGILIQGLTGIITLVFTFILIVGQYTIGEYVSGTIEYILNDKKIMFIISFYVESIIFLIYSIWIIPSEYLISKVNSSLLIFGTCILLLIPLYNSLSKLFQPESILDTISIDIKKELKEGYGNYQLIFSIILKLSKKNELNGAIYGLDKITDIFSKSYDEKTLLYLTNIIPHYERIAIESFIFEPNVAEYVINSYQKLIESIKERQSFLLRNIGNQIAESSVSISNYIRDELYSINTIISSYNLTLEIFEYQAIQNPEYIFSYDLKYIDRMLGILNYKNFPPHYYTGFKIQKTLSNLFNSSSFDNTKMLFDYLIKKIPRHDWILMELFNFIIETVPLEEEI